MAPAKESRFRCSWDQCFKTFNRKSDLCRHYRIHINDRPYLCTVNGCDKSFIQRSALTVHSRTHTGEKPHVCTYEGCRKAFSDSSSLSRHRRVHTGVRPYVCQEQDCKRSFCRRTSLTKHQESNHASILIESSSKSGILDGLCASDSQILEATSIADDTWSLLEQSHLSSPTSNYMFGWEHHMSTSILPAHENMQELSMQRNLLMQQQQSHSISNQHQLFRLLEYYT